MSTRSKADFSSIFLQLKTILNNHADGKLRLRESQTGACELIGPPSPLSRGKEVWFGAVRMGKSYVSYHLMPVYVFPDLLDDLSPGLKKRMQGKSCFNFTHTDEMLFQELERLTNRSHTRYQEEGFLE